MDDSMVIPKKLARELSIDEKRIRRWLRDVEMRPESEKGAPWNLTTQKADMVGRQFSQRGGAALRNQEATI